jgi:hypothetical protein
MPKDIWASLGLKSGNKVSFVINKIPMTKRITSLKDIVSKPGKPVSIEDMNATIRAKAAKQPAFQRLNSVGLVP